MGRRARATARILPAMLFPLLAVLSLVLVTTPAQASNPELVWHQDFATARALAQNTGAPLLVTFRCEA